MSPFSLGHGASQKYHAFDESGAPMSEVRPRGAVLGNARQTKLMSLFVHRRRFVLEIRQASVDSFQGV